jgi:hypothetical protein
MNCITAYCRISDHAVYRNGQGLPENKKGDLPGLLLSLYQHLNSNYPKFYKMDNLSKLGWLTAESLLKEENLLEFYQPEEVGLSLANANASLDTDLKYYESVKGIPSPALFVYTLPNIMIGEICIRNNFKGESGCYISREFDAGLMEQTVGYLLDNNILKACIAGWVDVLGEDFKAVLYLVEKEELAKARRGEFAEDRLSDPFTKETIHEIFQGENG